jgi:hypothetical protein
MASAQILDVSQLIAKDIEAINKKQKAAKAPSINARKLAVNDYAIHFDFVEKDMTSILSTATDYDIISEYLSIITNNRSNIIDPETGLSYFACNDIPINSKIKKVTFINDDVYRTIDQHGVTLNKLGLSFDIRKVLETNDNIYYDISYMINIISNPGILRQSIIEPITDFEGLINRTLNQSLLDLPRNKSKVLLGEYSFDFIYNKKESHETYIKEVTSKLKNIYDICYDHNNDHFITSKIVFGIIMNITQTFDALDNKIYDDIKFLISKKEEQINKIKISLDDGCLSVVKQYIPRIPIDQHDPPFVNYYQSSILYKCYDYVNDTLYATNFLIIPKLQTTNTYINKLIMEQRTNLQTVKPGKSPQYASSISDLVLPMTKSANGSIKFAIFDTKPESNSSKTPIFNIEFPRSWGNANVLDYVFAHQLIGRNYMPGISTIISRPINTISDLVIKCKNFQIEQIHAIMEDFFPIKFHTTKDIKIIQTMYKSKESGVEYPIFFLIRKTNTQNPPDFFNLIYYVSPSSLPKYPISDEYNKIITTFMPIPNKRQFLPVTYNFNNNVIINNSEDAIKLVSLLTLYSTINGIISLVDNINKKHISVPNFNIFFSQLGSLLGQWQLFENKHVKLARVNSGAVARTSSANGAAASVERTHSAASVGKKTIRNTSGATKHTKSTSLEGGRKIKRKLTKKRMYKKGW